MKERERDASDLTKFCKDLRPKSSVTYMDRIENLCDVMTRLIFRVLTEGMFRLITITYIYPCEQLCPCHDTKIIAVSCIQVYIIATFAQNITRLGDNS